MYRVLRHSLKIALLAAVLFGVGACGQYPSQAEPDTTRAVDDNGQEHYQYQRPAPGFEPPVVSFSGGGG